MTDTQRNINGQLRKKPLWPPLRILFTVTGISIFLGTLTLIARHLLQLRAMATATLDGGLLTVTATYSLLGREFRKTQTVIPGAQVRTVQFEKRQRISHLVVGFGFLAVGLFCGVHWLLNGLGAGYPYLFLAGAGVILAGVAIDLILNHLIPNGRGQTSVSIATAGWRFRLTGVSESDASQFVSFAAGTLASPAIHNRPSTKVQNEPATE
ncbi:MAG: hypothetical protein JXX14_24465 [Deltaproteobacteria bacterium]|nr:hypothetical protein [Deltaproteobacteria bacterium]